MVVLMVCQALVAQGFRAFAGDAEEGALMMGEMDRAPSATEAISLLCRISPSDQKFKIKIKVMLKKNVHLIALEMGVLTARHEVLAAGEAPCPGLAIGFAGERGVVLLRLVAAVL